MARTRCTFQESRANRRALFGFVWLRRSKIRQIAEAIEGLEFCDGHIVESGRGTRTRGGQRREEV